MSCSRSRSRFALWTRFIARRSDNSGPAVVLEPGFFDQYPRFYDTSETGAVPGRLNARYRALIAGNLQAIRDRTIVDLACHDGRWSFAALMAGARHVIGIEARPELVQSAEANLNHYRIVEDRYRFIVGDAIEQLDSIQPDSIDTVFCFGFFYHTPHHMLLLSKIARLNPRHLILDTAIQPSRSHAFIAMYKEKVAIQANAALHSPGDPAYAVVGTPTRAALELMLSSFGWQFTYYDWHNAGIADWQRLPDYRDDRRITLTATRD
jgi:precorrin-6B methylase 2